MQYKGEIESNLYPGFYHIPEMEHLLIDVNGHVINLAKKFCPIPKISGGYYHLNSLFLHRLLAITFLPKPEIPIEELDVNHKDGIKINNDLDNLEWATRAENCLHAYRTGLRTDNRPVLVKDLRDQSIRRFYSLQECARTFNIDGSQLHLYLRDYNRHKVSLDYYVFIYEGDDWPNLSDADIGRYRNGTAKAIMAININTKERFIFESRGALGKELCYNPGTVAMHMWRNGEKPFNGWVFKYIDDSSLVDKSKIIKLNKSWKRTQQKPVPIRVTNIQTNDVKEWISTEAFGNSLNVSKNTIQAGMGRNGGIWKNYRIDYLNSN
jgi:hypothetical protein